MKKTTAILLFSSLPFTAMSFANENLSEQLSAIYQAEQQGIAKEKAEENAKARAEAAEKARLAKIAEDEMKRAQYLRDQAVAEKAKAVAEKEKANALLKAAEIENNTIKLRERLAEQALLQAQGNLPSLVNEIAISTACTLMANHSLKTQPYSKDDKGYRCASSPVRLEQGNYVQYVASGSQTTIDALTLILDINNVEKSQQAKAKFIAKTDALTQAAIGKNTPTILIEAIKNNQNKTYFFDGSTLKVTSTLTNDGGYETHYLIL